MTGRKEIAALLTNIYEKGDLDFEDNLKKDLEGINKGGMRDGEILKLVWKYFEKIELKISGLTEKQQEDSDDNKEIEQWTDWLNKLEELKASFEREIRGHTEYDNLR